MWIDIPAAGADPAGKLLVNGSNGSWEFFQLAGGVWSGPAYDPGTLIAWAGGYKYTGISGEAQVYDASGNMTSWTSADGGEVFNYTYNGSNQIISMEKPAKRDTVLLQSNRPAPCSPASSSAARAGKGKSDAASLLLSVFSRSAWQLKSRFQPPIPDRLFLPVLAAERRSPIHGLPHRLFFRLRLRFIQIRYPITRQRDGPGAQAIRRRSCGGVRRRQEAYAERVASGSLASRAGHDDGSLTKVRGIGQRSRLN